jgi:hypothetical protein
VIRPVVQRIAEEWVSIVQNSQSVFVYRADFRDARKDRPSPIVGEVLEARFSKCLMAVFP